MSFELLLFEAFYPQTLWKTIAVSMYVHNFSSCEKKAWQSASLGGSVDSNPWLYIDNDAIVLGSYPIQKPQGFLFFFFLAFFLQLHTTNCSSCIHVMETMVWVPREEWKYSKAMQEQISCWTSFILSACGQSSHSLCMSWLAKLNLGWGGLSILFHFSENTFVLAYCISSQFVITASIV